MLKGVAVCMFSTSSHRLSSLQVVINLGLVYKVQYHSGVIFQFVAFIRKRKRTVPDIVAAGGRYDHLVGLLQVIDFPHLTCFFFLFVFLAV